MPQPHRSLCREEVTKIPVQGVHTTPENTKVPEWAWLWRAPPPSLRNSATSSSLLVHLDDVRNEDEDEDDDARDEDDEKATTTTMTMTTSANGRAGFRSRSNDAKAGQVHLSLCFNLTP